MRKKSETEIIAVSLYDEGGARVDLTIYKRGICLYRLERNGKNTSHRTLEGAVHALCEEAWCTSEFDGYDKSIEVSIGDGVPTDVLDATIWKVFEDNRGDGFYRRLWRKCYHEIEEARFEAIMAKGVA